MLGKYFSEQKNRNETNEDYYKPIKTKCDFNNNCIEYESRGSKDKRLSVKEYLYIIMPYLEDLINNHKALIKDSNSIIIKDDLSGECESILFLL